jgi:hypothetical protein
MQRGPRSIGQAREVRTRDLHALGRAINEALRQIESGPCGT